MYIMHARYENFVGNPNTWKKKFADYENYGFLATVTDEATFQYRDLF